MINVATKYRIGPNDKGLKGTLIFLQIFANVGRVNPAKILKGSKVIYL